MNPKTSTPSNWAASADELEAYQKALQNGERHAVMAFLVAARKKRLKQTWLNMRTRCYYPSAEHYSRYGGRGIKVCNEWRDTGAGFAAFVQWATHNGFYPDLTIDRENNDGDYTPKNCRWIPWLENYKRREITDHWNSKSAIELETGESL